MIFFIKTIATGFGAGYFPKIPGTFSSLIFGIIFYLLSPFFGIGNFIYGLIGLSFLGVWIAGSYDKITDIHDPSEVVIDEFVGIGIAILRCYGSDNIWLWLIAFVLFRFFDIAKPFPISKSQNFAGGWGVMIDDILAGIFSAVILLGIMNFLC